VTGRPTPTPMPPERYVDARELAQLMGVSQRTIDRMRGEGMPSVTWGRRTRRYLPSHAMSWAGVRIRPLSGEHNAPDQPQSKE
jgi:predicted DNA-binding transcriptional regulator AlpA